MAIGCDTFNLDSQLNEIVQILFNLLKMFSV